MNMDSVRGGFLSFKTEVLGIRDSFRERGAKFFIRPLAIGGMIIFASDFYIAQPSKVRLAQLDADLLAARATAEFADDYNMLKERLAVVSSKLPRTKNTEQWLLNTVRQGLAEEDIVPLKISQAKDTIKGDYRFISITVTCQAKYSQIASWVARLEQNKSLLYVQTLNIQKIKKPVGLNNTTVKVTTVVSSRRSK